MSGDCVAGILSIGDGFPPNLAILGDEFLKSCESAITMIYDLVDQILHYAMNRVYYIRL